MTSLYPLYHKLENRPVTVIGGGRIALRRLRRLLESGARVTVVSPDVLPEIRSLHEEGRIEWRARPYAPGDLEGAAFVLAATGRADLVPALRAEASARGIPFNSAEDESFCDFHVPGLVEKGGIKIALSSQGASPAFVKRLRVELEEWLDRLDLADLERLAGERARRERGAEPSDLGAGLEGGPPKSGRVYLVGAGPGDPGLLTVRAVELLRAADIVFHDRLVSELILATIPERVEKVYVGKDIGCAHRANIARLLIEAARRGQVVVRLKGGDPVLFGRGGEEMLALADAGVEFEVVPGVSALCAVPAAAGIPVTFRGIASELVVRSGHTMADPAHPPAAPPVPAGETTFVYFMAVSRLASVVEDLRREGLPDSTPVAIVEKGTLPGQRVVAGDLGTILPRAQAAALEAPALVIAGDVVRLRERLQKEHA